ncbi:CaiB/BaiF CoA-transferase family protein [Oceanicola sp. 22II-s10i]|uniref:CaiB/BaiF CoA transferase family protein n=1 Tax=Oceanicola sp. 22II-s10i TaxID=1317116 RepID=UPI000B524B2E|nr:CoA transferase [Oceanicola sp. 22II-s10i]
MTNQPSAEQQQSTGLPYETLPIVESGQTFGFLNGVRVLDLTTSVAGPYATMLLSDFGAEIIKVERPAGDDARAWGPPFLHGQALWFAAVNRNKRSVVIDAQSEAGRADLLALVRTADVVVTNQPPSVQKKLGLDYDTLKQEREGLIFVAITGFGLEGERANLTCYDLIAEGYSGIMDITGPAGAEPQKIGAPAADMLAGQDAAMATMAALAGRHRNGWQGQCIDVSLVESMTRFLSCRISPYLGAGEIPERTGGRDSVIAIYQPFETADHPITLGLGSDAIWNRFWKALGDPEFAAREEFRSNADRRENRVEIVERIQSLLLKETRAHWLDVFRDARVPAGPINRVDEVAADEHLRARDLFYAVEDDQGRILPQIGLGIRINGKASTARLAPPRLGADTQAILRELKPSE